MFSWENNGISDTEFLKKIESANLISHTTSKYNKKSNSLEEKNLESVYEDDQICIYKEYTDNGKYKYLVKGTFNDITAWAFYQSQIDIEYRKKWDKYLLAADKLEQNTQQDSDIIHWIMQFPYPMYDREYVYIRRHKYDKDKNVIVIMSRAVNYPIQDDKNYVRVTEYTSNLVIKPHDAIDKNGFDFELEYYDDPQSFFSNSLYNWVSKTSIIEFIQRLHEAAKDYHPISLNEDNKVGTSFEVVQRNTTDLPNTIATNKVMSNSRVEMMEKSFENVKEKPRNIASN